MFFTFPICVRRSGKSSPVGALRSRRDAIASDSKASAKVGRRDKPSALQDLTSVPSRLGCLPDCATFKG